MRTYAPLLLAAAAVAMNPAAAASGSVSASVESSASASGSSSLSAEVAAIAECTDDQLTEAMTIMSTNEREAQCEEAMGMTTGQGAMLQVTSEDEALEMCDVTACTAALKQLYNQLPNCRYEAWALQYSAEKLLEYCSITPTNTTSSTSSDGSVGWTVGGSGSSTFVPAGATTAPTAASDSSASTAADSSSGSSAAPSTVASVALTAAAGLVAVFLA